MKTSSDMRWTPDNRSPASKKTFAILAGVVLLAIVLLTQLPEEAKRFLHTRGRFHTAGHVIAFSVLAFAVGRTQRSWKARLMLLVGLIFFGFLTELAEFYSIALEWKDVLGDSAGVLLGTSIAILTTRRRSLWIDKNHLVVTHLKD